MLSWGTKRAWAAVFVGVLVSGVAGAASEFYVDQTSGVNSSSTTGAAASPHSSFLRSIFEVSRPAAGYTVYTSHDNSV